MILQICVLNSMSSIPATFQAIRKRREDEERRLSERAKREKEELERRESEEKRRKEEELRKEDRRVMEVLILNDTIARVLI